MPVEPRGNLRIKRAAQRAEDKAWKSVRSSFRYSNPVGRAAIRSGQVAATYFARARQLLLDLETRCAAAAAEKQNRIKAARSEFNKIAPWNTKRKKRVA